MDANPISFELKGAYGSVTPAIWVTDYGLAPTGLSAGIGNICAYINGSGVVATDETSWDSLKSLYR